MNLKRHGAVALLLLIAAAISLWVLMNNREKEQTKTWVISSGQKDGTYAALAQELVSIVKTYSDVSITTASTSPGSVENLQRLVAKKVDLALVQNDTPGSTTIRVLAPLYEEVLHFLVRADSGIHGVGDLANPSIKVEIGPPGSGTERLVLGLLDHYGVKPNVAWGRSDITEAGRRLIANESQAMLVVQSLKSRACQKILASPEADIRFVSLGQAGLEGNEATGFTLECPFVRPTIIPVRAYHADDPARASGKPPEPIASLAVRTLLVCRDDFPEDVARQITETIYKYRALLINAQPAAACISENFDPAALQFPLHSGAKEYYDRNQPSFLSVHAELMAFFLSALFALSGMALAAARWVTQRKKDRIDEYYLALDALFTRTAAENLNQEALRQIEADLTALRRQAVADLVRERLRPDESFSIFQSLLRNCQDNIQRKMATNEKTPPRAGRADRAREDAQFNPAVER